MTESIQFSTKGLVLRIQRFQVHDGPGIRDTVFLKGCPLLCDWCSTPESQQPHPEIMTYDQKCIACDRCVEACPVEAITADPLQGRVIHREKCDLCLKCAEACPSGSIVVAGEYMTVEEVIKEVMSDEPFYKNSGGGVTVSGGEPLAQPTFTRELFKALKNKNLHAALDTCGFAKWEVMEAVLEHTDLVLFDIKHMDTARHITGTGQNNSMILENARKAASRNRLWIRVPLIPRYNDTEENITQLAKFGVEIGAEQVSLLPYHEWGTPSYERLGRKYPLEGLEPIGDARIDEAKEICEATGLKVVIGK